MTIHTSFARLSALLLAAPICLWAATPPSGTLTDTSGPITYAAGPFSTANPTPVPQVDSGPQCNNPSQPCDDYDLTLTLPAGYAVAHPLASIKVTAGWTDVGTGKSDYDLYIFKYPRADCTPSNCTVTNGSQAANYQSASGNNPEIANASPLHDGSTKFTVAIVPYTPSGETVSVRIELLPGSGGGGSTSFGGADPTTPGVPRYQNFYAPAGTTAEASQGEFSIGFNPATHRIMTMNTGPVWRITPAEIATPSAPEVCPELWEDKSSANTSTGLDPILWTDQKTGRTFASNSTAGANGAYAYSDNDGDLWVPFSVSGPNGGADHQTIGSGPYPAALAALTTPLNQGEFALYCSQDIVGPAFCQRSDTLGSTWGNGVPAYTGTTTQCHGLHGHVHVAPNGTAWLPVNQCGSKQGGAVSTDAGTTWNEFLIPGSVPQIQGADPSVAIDSNNTAYYCYVNNEPVLAGNPPEGHVHVKISRNGGQTWVRDTDLGASHGIVNAAHTEAVGGSAGRAACGFMGTNVPGDYQSGSFPGNWYAFIATTYDEGLTWVTVNATPNDPVQSMTGIWQQGGSQQDRNLLDFNEITIDDRGRALYGYSDGCVNPGCIAGTAGDDYVGFMRVARQNGGKSLFASMDVPEPMAPNRACLAGTRDPAAVHLTWKAPDNGGANIANYQILRGTTSGSEVLLGQTGTAKTTFTDATADPLVTDYFYEVKALNSSGTGLASNEVDMKVVVPPPPENVCRLPGLTELTDASGDNTPPVPGTDLHSFQLAQPYATDGLIRLAFTINTDPGQSPQPAGSAWYVAMKIPDPAPATTFHYRAVHMAWPGPMPVFESYTPAAGNSGGVDGRFVDPATIKPAEASSSYVTPFGKVVIIVKASDLGLSPGDTMSFVSGSAQSTDPANIGVGATSLYDQMPDSLSFTGSYAVQDNFACNNDIIFRNGFQ